MLGRRTFLQAGAFSAFSLLAPWRLAWAEDAKADPALDPTKGDPRTKPGAIIVLWLGGGPSQLETFDPKPGTKEGGPTKAIKTRAPGIEIGEDYPRLADSMDQIALIRSLVTPDGEHERGTYYLRTGYRLAPSVAHPALGAVFAHELAPKELEIPAHIAIEPSFGAPRGGLLGASYDAFATGDPKDPLPDVKPHVDEARLDKRAKDLSVVESAFAKGREDRAKATGHAALAERARSTMTSPRLKAFDYKEEPKELLAKYGDSAFGRGCLVARRLVQQGVRAIEVGLPGWDTHADNFPAHKKLASELDPAFATLIADLKDKGLLETTLVVCMGEFGRTPKINIRDGRDHHTKGFSVALAGRSIKGGALVGETSVDGESMPTEPVTPGDLFATIYKASGLDWTKQNVSPAGRPIALAEGKPVAKVLAT